LAVLPPLAWALWRWRHRLLPRPRVEAPAEAPLEPIRVAALEELARLPRPYHGAPAGPWLQALNALLKRLSRARWPDDNCHTLSGRAWLAFLDNRCPAAGLTRYMILVEGGYRAECKLDDKAIEGLAAAVETWVRKHV
ncbi:DUF4381 domain-containing protein, partial [Pseudomonas citronellolis]|uniref:DUF4381 domain-containing protein n=1 Tax=Pseudomonas citronellolis TaxID=53408 RepID=UPI0023E36E34